jgi:hypothetical protein
MPDVTVWVEHGSGKQTIPIFKRDQLTAMEMSGEHQVIAAFTRSFPDGRVMCAQNSIVALRHRNCIRAGNRNHPRTMRHANRRVLNPITAAAHHCFANSIHAHMAVMVSAYCHNRCVVAKGADQIAQFAQFRRFIDQIAAQEHTVRVGIAHCFDHLPTEVIGAFPPKMNVADIHQATRVIPRRKAFLSNVKGSLKADFESST